MRLWMMRLKCSSHNWVIPSRFMAVPAHMEIVLKLVDNVDKLMSCVQGRWKYGSWGCHTMEVNKKGAQH